MSWITIGAGNVSTVPFADEVGNYPTVLVLKERPTGTPRIVTGIDALNPLLLRDLGSGDSSGGGSTRPSDGFLYPRGDN